MHKHDPQTNTWHWRFGRKGKRYFRGGFQTAEQAQHDERSFWDRLIKEEMFPGLVGNDLTFKEAIDWWMKEYAHTKKTAYIDTGRLSLAAKFFDTKKLSEIRPEDIDKFLDELPALRKQATPRLKGVSDSTRNHYRSLLSAVFSRLKRRLKYAGENPVLLTDARKVPKARVRWLYPQEEATLSPLVAQEPNVWAYYFMGLHTGMRVSEMMAIQVKDIDFVLNQLFIPNSKNSCSRYVALSPKAVEFLTAAAAGKGPEDKVLPQFSYTYLREHFRALCEIAKVPDFTIHSMRHTFAQRLLSHGESIYLVSKLLGHSTVVVTQNHYGHLATQDLARTVSQIDGAFTMAQAGHSSGSRMAVKWQ
jgi:integrase